MKYLFIPLLFIFVGCSSSVYIESTSDEYFIAIQPRFQSVSAFSEGLAAASVRAGGIRNRVNMYGFINKAGEWVVEPRFLSVEDFQDGVAIVYYLRNEDFFGFGLINTEGEWVVEPGRYLSFNRFFGWETDIVVTSFPPREVFEEQNLDYVGTAGVINAYGEEIIPLSLGFRHVMPASACGYYFSVWYNGRWGVINLELEVVVPLEYEQIVLFLDGIARVRIDGKYGFINKQGEAVIAPQFDRSLGHFSDGLARVRIDGKSGFINTQGEFAITPQFDYAYPFWYGLARIRMDGYVGLIDTDGNFIVEPQFRRIGDFNNGYAEVRTSDGATLFINKQGEIAVPPVTRPEGILPFRCAINDLWGFMGFN